MCQEMPDSHQNWRLFFITSKLLIGSTKPKKQTQAHIPVLEKSEINTKEVPRLLDCLIVDKVQDRNDAETVAAAHVKLMSLHFQLLVFYSIIRGETDMFSLTGLSQHPHAATHLMSPVPSEPLTSKNWPFSLKCHRVRFNTKDSCSLTEQWNNPKSNEDFAGRTNPP